MLVMTASCPQDIACGHNRDLGHFLSTPCVEFDQQTLIFFDVNFSKNKMQVILIRHAESQANLDPDLICGRSEETPLSEKGEAQAKALGSKFLGLYKEAPLQVFVSTAVRTRRTASLAFPDAKLVVDERLCEQSAGVYENTSRKISYTTTILEEMNKKHIHYASPQGESIAQAGERISHFINEEMEKKTRLIIVSHSMAIEGVVQKLVQLKPESTYLTGCDNASITELAYNPSRGWFLVRLNV